MRCPNINHEDWKELVSLIGEDGAWAAWIKNGEEIPNPKDYLNYVNYSLKVVAALNSPKVRQPKKDNKEGFINDLIKQGVPQQQINFITPLLEEGKYSKEEIKEEILLKYSFGLEIKIAKDKEGKILPNIFQFKGDVYTFREGKYFLDPAANPAKRKEISKAIYDFAYSEASIETEVNSSVYSNLTVPGGINYTENEIKTPDITPNIKGHGQFSTDQGIGWFRSDNQSIGGTTQGHEQVIGEGTENEIWTGKIINLTTGGIPTKTRRILEIQSDLFQKGRDEEVLVKFSGTTESIKNKNKFLQLFNKDNSWVTFFIRSILQDSSKKGYEKVLFPTGDTAAKVEGHETLEGFKQQQLEAIKRLEDQNTEEALLKQYNTRLKADQSDFDRAESDKSDVLLTDTTDHFVPPKTINSKYNFVRIRQNYYNKGFQNLNQSDNLTNDTYDGWVLYEYTVGEGNNVTKLTDSQAQELLDKANNINRITRENQLKQTKKALERTINSKEEIINEYKINIERAIAQHKLELERIERDGFTALNPIHKFYEEVIKKILDKRRFKPVRITDEYGNDWYEVSTNVDNQIYLSPPDNIDIQQIGDDLFVPGFTPHLQNEVVNDITEQLLIFIQETPGISFNQAVNDYVANAKIYISEGDDKYQPIVENIDRFRVLVKDKLDRLGLLDSRISDPDQAIDSDGSGDEQSDGFYWEDDWVYKFDTKANAQRKIKEFLLFIPRTVFKDGQYSEITNFLNNVSYMTYDEIFEDLKAILADIPNTWTDQRRVLEEHQESKSWIHSLLFQIDNYEGDQQQLLNQFTVTFSSTYSNFKTLIWNDDKGAFDVKLIDTDQNSAQKTLLAKWKDNFNQSKLLSIDEEGNPVVVKQELDEALQLLEEIKTTKKGIKSFLNNIGTEVSNKTIIDLLEGRVGGLSFEQHFTSADKGLFYNIKNRLAGKDAKGVEIDEVNNPVINNSGMRTLALSEVKNNPSIYSNSLINGEGNTVYSYSLNKFLTKRLLKFKDKNFIDQLSQLTFQKPIIDEDQPLYKSWIWQIQNNELFLENFEAGSFDTIRKQTGFDNGVKLTNMSDIDLELTKWSAFQNKGKSVKGLGRLANYLFTVPSKTTAYVFTAPAIDIGVSFKGNEYRLDKTPKNALYSIALAELNRINSAKGRTIKTNKYKSGSEYFYFFPQLNNIKEIWNTDGTVKLPSTKVGEDTVERIIRATIETSIKQDVDAKIKYWEDIGFLDKDKNFVYIDSSYKKILKFDNNANAQLAALDYIINNTLFEFNLHQTFIGDPAIYFKNNVEDTWDEIGKRLAAMIAPGKDLALESESEQFISVKLKDRKGNLALNYTQMLERFSEIYGKEKAEKILDPYTDLNGTDAQEFVTLREKVTILYKLGELTTEMYNSLLDRMSKSKDIKLSDEEISIIFQPDKPVYVSQDIIAEEDVMSMEYVKSSSIPLIPQFTKGLELDKLRLAMEKLESEQNLPVRAAFQSATKVGGVSAINIFNEDGSIKDKLDLIKSSKTLFRSGFRIQQDVPYDPDYEFVVKSSQATKLLFDSILNTKGFNYKGQTLIGNKLLTNYNQLHESLFNLTREKLENEIIDPVTGAMNIEKIQKLLVKEATIRSYSPAEIAALSLLPDNTFEFPFWAVTGSKKYESILTSLYTNNIIKQKMHGASYVLVSEEGNIGNSKAITYTSAYDPKIGLKPMRIEEGIVKEAQILIPWRFKANLKNYIKDGIIDTSKLPTELLEQFGFRIPNQGHNSMALLEVVGFLPKGSNHVIVSRNFIVQMGSDFDVDKLYIYDYFTKEQDGRIIKDLDPISSIKNDILDIHKSVLSNPEVFNQVVAPLENVKDTDIAKFLKRTFKTKVTNYLSPDYKKQKYLESVDGKSMVGITALANTLNGIIQPHGLYIQIPATRDKPAMKDSIVFGDEKGRKITLSDLSNPLTWRGNQKSSKISADLSAAVDNEKDPILSYVNNNPITSPAILALRQLGFEEDHYDMLMVQPYIKQFTNSVRKQKSSVGKRGRNIEKYWIDSYLTTATEEYLKTLSEADQAEYDPNKLLYYPLTVKEMQENLNKPSALINLISILKFQQAYDYGSSLQQVQRAINIESKGVGKSVLELSLKAENINQLLKIKNISHVPSVIGEFTEEGFRPTTYSGSIIYHGLLATNKGLASPKNDLFKYNSRSFRKVLTDFEKIYGIYPTVEQTSSIWNAFKSFQFSRAYTTDERKKIFFGKDSLARRVKKYLKTKDGATNPFLIRLNFDTSKGTNTPDFIFYNAAKEEYIEEVGIYQGLINLLTSSDEIARQIGEDLVTYFYINGGIQEAKQWGKYIHPAYLKSYKGGQLLRHMQTLDFEELRATGSENTNEIAEFTIQYFQHNPWFVRDLDTKSKGVEVSSNEEKIAVVSSFNSDIPVLPIDNDGLYPELISVKTPKGDRGYKLYRKESEDNEKTVYSRIQVLGTKNFVEYNNHGKGISLVNQSISKKAIIAPPIKVQNKPKNDTKTIPTEKAWYEGDINEVLDKIDKGNPKWRALIKLLKEKKYTGSIVLNESLRSGGMFDSQNEFIEVNPNNTDSIERVIIHEVIHAATLKALSSKEGLTDNQIKAVESLKTLATNLRKRVLNGELEYAGFFSSELLEFDNMLANHRRIPLTGDDLKKFKQLRGIYYGISSFEEKQLVEEFLTEALTMPAFQNALNRIKYDSNKTLLDRLIELISNIINSLGVKSDTVLEAVVKDIVVLIADKQQVEVKPRKITFDRSRNDLPPGILSAESLADNTSEEYKKFIDQYATRLRVIDQSISVARINDDKKRVEELLTRKEEVQKELDELEESQVLSTILRIGKEDLTKIEKMLNQPTVSENDLNYILRVITLWQESDQLLLEKSDRKEITQRAKDIDRELVSPARLLYNKWNDVARTNLLKAVKASSGLSNLTDQVINAQDKISALTSNLMDISRSGNIILDVMSRWMRESSYKASLEANIIYVETDKLIEEIKKTDIFKKEGYYIFAQKNEDGALTGEYIQSLEAKYYKVRNQLIEDASNASSKEEKKTKWKKYFEWLRANHTFFDIRKLYKIDNIGLYTYNPDKVYLEGLKKNFGEKFEDLLEEQKQKIEYYNERLQNKITTLDSDDPNTFRELNKWKTKYDPSIYLKNVLSNDYTSTIVDGEYIKNEGHEFVVKRAIKQWEDIQFNKIQNNPALKAFYDYSVKTLNSLYHFIPPAFKEGITSTTIPNVPKSVAETFNEKGMSAAWSQINNNAVDSISISSIEEQTRKLQDPLTKKPEQTLGVRYLSDLDAEEKSYDLGKVLKIFSLDALQFKHKAIVEDQIKLAYSILEESLENVKAPSGRNMTDRLGAVLTVKDGENLRKQVEYAIRVFYDDRKNIQGTTNKKVYKNKAKTKYSIIKEAIDTKNWDKKAKDTLAEMIDYLNKKKIKYDPNKEGDIAQKYLESNTRFIVGSRVGDQLLKYMQLKGMGWNIFGSITNVTFGWFSNFIHAAGAVDFTTDQLLKANRIMLGTSSFASGNSIASKVNSLMNKFDVLKELNNAAYDATTGANRARKGMEHLAPFELQRKGEYFVQGMTLIASMLNTKVTLNGVETNLWEAFDDRGDFKDKTNKDWGGEAFVNDKEANKELYKFKFKLDQVNKSIHGNYDPNSPVRIKSGILGRAVMQFRSWIAEGIANRFEDKKYDSFLGRERKGRWRTYYDLGFKDSIKVMIRLASGKSLKGYVNDIDLLIVSENMRRNLAELYIKLSLLGLYLVIQGLDIDDDDDYKKKARNLAFNQILRLQDDIEFYYSPLAVENITQNFIPAFNVVKDSAKFIDALEKGIVHGDWDYKTGKKAGENRLLWTGAKLFPFGSSMVSFINKTENEEGFRK